MTLCQAESQTPFDHEPPRLPPSDPDTAGTPDPDPIRIYVACLAAYNNGYLHGSWIEVTDLDAIWKAVRAMLSASPIDDAEEWAIHDYEGFEGLQVSEYQSFETVIEMAEFIEEHGALGGKLAEHFGGDLDDAKKALSENYHGEYESLADYAEQYFKDTGQNVPDYLEPYIDWKAVGRDFDYSGDIFTIETGFNCLHIFGAH